MRRGKATEDVRTKVSIETFACIAAEASIRHCHPNEVVREILDSWADREFHRQTLVRERLEREGIAGQHGTPRE